MNEPAHPDVQGIDTDTQVDPQGKLNNKASPVIRFWGHFHISFEETPAEAEPAQIPGESADAATQVENNDPVNLPQGKLTFIVFFIIR